MAGKKVADIYSEVSFRWDKKSLKLLKEFKKEISETKNAMRSLAKMRSGPAQRAAQNAVKSMTDKEKRRNAESRKQIKLLRAEARLRKKMAMLPKGSQEKATIASMASRARSGFERGKLTGAEFDERMLKAQAKADTAIGRMDRRTVAAKNAAALRDLSKGASKADSRVRLLRQEMRKLNASMVNGSISNKKYSASVMRMKTEMRQLNRTTKKTRTDFDALRSGLLAATGAYTAFAAAAEVTRIGQQFEKTRVLLNTIFGDEAPAIFNQLSAQAQRLGQDINTASNSFAKYAVSGQALGFTNQQMLEQFRKLSEASIVFGLSTEQQLGVFRAFEQIAS